VIPTNRLRDTYNSNTIATFECDRTAIYLLIGYDILIVPLKLTAEMRFMLKFTYL
jgi:hypothetical protein